MFDTYITERGHAKYVTVTEKRAVTDESLKLLREMESKAREAVEATVRIQNSDIECVVHASREFLNDEGVITAFVYINGKKIRAQYRFYLRDKKRLDEIAFGIRDELAKVIASHLLTEMSGPDLLRMINGLRV